jgi:hypothetical protein
MTHSSDQQKTQYLIHFDLELRSNVEFKRYLRLYIFV